MRRLSKPAAPWSGLTINVGNATQVNLRGTTASYGGTFNINSTLVSQLNANKDSPAGATGSLTVTAINFANNTGVTLVNGNTRFVDAVTVAGGANAFTIGAQSSNTMNANFTGTAAGVFTKGDANTLTLQGDLSGYAGKIVVKAGTLDMKPTVATNFFGGTIGTSKYLIGDSRSVQDQSRGFAILQANTDFNWDSRIDTASTGLLGLITNNTTLTGLGSSSA